MDVVNFLIFWAKNHPIVILAALVAFLVVSRLLNRKSAADREAERVVKNLVESSKDKYKETRPLR